MYIYASRVTDRQIKRDVGWTVYDDVDVFQVGRTAMGNDICLYL